MKHAKSQWEAWDEKHTACWAQSIIRDKDKTVNERVTKSEVTPQNAHVCSHLSSLLSLPLFITLFLLHCSHSVFFWNRPSVMSTEISRHSAGASEGLTFPPTCDLHQRRGSWGIFHASEGRRSSDGESSGGGRGWVGGGGWLVPWGLMQ